MAQGFASVLNDPAFHVRRLLRRRAGMLGRAVLVCVVGLAGLCVIASMALGYINGGVRTSYGVGTDLATSRTVELDSRLISDGRYNLLSITDAGRAAGLQPGGELDMTQWSVAQKLGFAFPVLPRPSKIAEHQTVEAVILAESANRRIHNLFFTRVLEILVRLVLLGSALLIIQFSHGRAALAAGLYLAVAAMADGVTITFAGLPLPVQEIAIAMASLARPLAYLARVAFSMELCPGPRKVKLAMWAVFAVLLAIVFALSLGDLATLLFNAPRMPVSPIVLPLAQCATQLYSLGIFAAAAIAAPKGHRFVLRIIFVATFVTLASYLIQEGFVLSGTAPPLWMGWYFSAALLGAGIGYPWAIFARRIAGVDFIISRGVAYAISVIIILGAISVAKNIVQSMAGDWVTGFVLIYGIPVALSLSFNWLQGWMTRLIGLLLDADLRNAGLKINALRADFPKAADVNGLAAMVRDRAGPALHMQNATVYLREGNEDFRAVLDPANIMSGADPAIQALDTAAPVELQETNSALTGGLLFELRVFGQNLGALHCGPRPHGKGYDPAERALLAALSYDIAVAIICLTPGVKDSFRVEPRLSPSRSSI